MRATLVPNRRPVRTLPPSAPGLLTLSGIIAGGISVNSGGVRLNGTASGSIVLAPVTSLSGIGKAGGTVGGGVISPGNGAGIFTAGKTTSNAAFVSLSSGIGPEARTGYSFEYTQPGAPVFNSASASGNDVLRLTDLTFPISTLNSTNEINLYFNLATGVRLGDSFLGGFFTDKNAPFDTAITNATWRVFLADPTQDEPLHGSRRRDRNQRQSYAYGRARSLSRGHFEVAA